MPTFPNQGRRERQPFATIVLKIVKNIIVPKQRKIKHLIEKRFARLKYSFMQTLRVRS